MANLLPGTLVDVDLGGPPATRGREQQKRRPCVVLAHLEKLGLLIIVPVSGSKPTSTTITTVPLIAGANGLLKDSFALCHQIRSVSPDRRGRVYGKLSALDMERVRLVLKQVLQL